ncbi:MAG: aminopeptidase, partial [Lachnospiraceae bacterium]|nr:aminopeptidase [Lachnospiraceae bacterium]
MERPNAWKTYDDESLKELEKLCEGYRGFLNKGKTERECVKQIISAVAEKGYVNLQDIIDNKKTIKAGDKIYSICMDKTVALFNIGKKPIEEGINILGAHIDSPRMDIKQNPLYEKGDFAYLDTHYYGGIKKYQWVTLPLAIHGVVVKKDGKVLDISIGEDKDDPVFCVTDLLIHLAGEQMEKKANKVIEGENLDILFGSCPIKDEDKDAVKKNILNIIKDKYDIEEEDFISAELEV